MAISILNARVWTKFLTGTTTVPTVPTAIDHNDPAWLTTDIYNSELAVNEGGILYTRYGTIQRLNRVVTVGDPISGVATNGHFLFNNAGVVGFKSIEAETDIEYQMSITADASGLKFVNDQLAPGNNYIYATSSVGTKGWRKLKKADFDDLVEDEIVFGAADGTADQSPLLTFSGTQLFVNSDVLFNGTAGTGLFWDNTNDRLGIGTITPSEQLQITKNFRFPSTASSSVGVFYKDAVRFLHSFGTENVFLGASAGNFTTSGTGANVGIGVNALTTVSTGSGNVVMGKNAGQFITTSSTNTYIGNYSGRNRTGSNNVGVGDGSLHGTFGTATGSDNVALGQNSGYAISSGSRNVLIGLEAGGTITTGSNNIVIGWATVDGILNTTGSNNIVIGYNIDLPLSTTSNYMSIGDIFKGDISTGILNIPTTPTLNATETNILVRNSVTGDIERLDASTIGSGVFQPLDATLTSLAAVSGVQGDLLYASAADTWTRLAKDTNATRYLSNTGGSNNPAWAQIDLTNGVTGVLPIANGGTGSSTQNFVDLTTGQTIAGEKVFSNNMTISTLIESYGGVATVQDGVPHSVAEINLTGQTAAIGASTIYTTPAADGKYLLVATMKVTTAATTSSTLGPFQYRFTEADDNVVTTAPPNNINHINGTTVNSTSTGYISLCYVIHAKASTNIQYVMGYTSSGATAMVYNLHIILYKL